MMIWTYSVFPFIMVVNGALQWHDLFIPQPLVLKQFSSNSCLQIELLGSHLTIENQLIAASIIDQQSSFQAGYYKFVAFRSGVT